MLRVTWSWRQDLNLHKNGFAIRCLTVRATPTIYGEPAEIRTQDTLIKSQVL